MAALALAALPALPPGALAETGFDPVGRWTQAEGAGRGHALAIGTVEIERCEAGFCGRLVEDAGCGAVVMRLALAGDGTLSGELALAERTFDVFLAAGDTPGESLVVTASEGLAVVSRSSMPLGAELVRAGPTLCPPLPVS